MAIKKTKIKRALKMQLKYLGLACITSNSRYLQWDDNTGKNKIQALFETPYTKRLEKNSE